MSSKVSSEAIVKCLQQRVHRSMSGQKGQILKLINSDCRLPTKNVSILTSFTQESNRVIYLFRATSRRIRNDFEEKKSYKITENLPCPPPWQKQDCASGDIPSVIPASLNPKRTALPSSSCPHNHQQTYPPPAQSDRARHGAIETWCGAARGDVCCAVAARFDESGAPCVKR